MKRTITIEDVARLAGVSKKTVSRVVNDEPHVKALTREAVSKAITELGYRPNLLAQALKTSRSLLIGLVTTRLDNHYLREILSLAIRACRQHNFHVVVEEVDVQNADAIEEFARSVRRLRYEGLILTTSVADAGEVLRIVAESQIPCVRLSPQKDDPRFHTVESDYIQGSRLIAQHLLNEGHERIAVATPWMNKRHHPVYEQLIDLGGDPQKIVDVRLDWTLSPIEAGRKMGTDVLATSPRPSAVFAFSDEVAAGLIGYAFEHGVHVPNDLSVIGYDDCDPVSLVWPPLTTVHQPLDLMVETAIDLLIMSRSSKLRRKIICPVSLVVRRSTTVVRHEK